MKISQANIRKFDESERSKTDLFYFDGGAVEENIVAAANGNFLTENPAAAVLAAGVAFAAPIAGMAFTNGMVSQAAELPQDQDVQATYVESAAADSDMVEVVSQIQDKVINFTANGPGHIEPAENCVIDGETGEIKFLNPDQNAAFTIVYDVDGATSRISAGNSVMPEGTDYVILEAHGSYATINIEFTDVVAEQRAAEEEAARQAAEQAAVEAAAQQQAQAAAQAAAQEQAAQQAHRSTSTPAPAPVQQAAPVQQQQQAAPAQQHVQAAAAAPFSGAAQHSMNAAEMAEARQIFDAYNQYRASKGLPQVAWSDDCANMAFGSATGCAASGNLTHKLGIPGGVQSNYSDILQYSTWKMSGNEAVQRWVQSNGHRKMMQCETSQVAGVGVYNNGGTWYYAIVYNFQGTNQSGA